MARKRKRHFEEEEEEESTWLDSYADMVTDLMAIFVILFSFAMANQAVVAYKAKVAEEADIAAVEVIVGEESPASQNALATLIPTESTASPEPTQESAAKADLPKVSDAPIQDSLNSLFETIRAYVQENGLSGDLSVTKLGKNRILVRVESSVLFPSGSATISQSAEPLLDKVAEIMITYNDYVVNFGIEGHTDNMPIKNSQFASNWELSTSRAVNVLRRMVEISKLDPAKVSAVGYGEYRPIAGNDTELGRSQNRRVDFIIETISDE